MRNSLVRIGAVCGFAVLYWAILAVSTVEDSHICERAKRAQSEFIDCQALPNCRASVEDMHRAINLHLRCEDYKE